MGQGGAPQLPHDIYGLALYPAGLPWWLWLGIVALLAAVAAGLYWWFAKRGRAAATIPVDPWKVLLEELRTLAPESPFHRERQQEFYFQLSLSVRRVIERRTGLRATDMTVGELREPLRKVVPLSDEAVSKMQSFFERADMVKFADAPATLGQAEEDHRTALQWFERLRPLSIHEDTQLYTESKGGAQS